MGRYKGRGRAWAAWREDQRIWRCCHVGCLRPGLGATFVDARGGRIKYRYSPSFCEEHKEREAAHA